MEYIRECDALEGKRFHHLVVIKKLREYNDNSKEKRFTTEWLCRCDCGEEVKKTHRALHMARVVNRCRECTRKCQSAKMTKHGFGKVFGETTTEYRTYYQMLTRCYNENSHAYHMYGGAGIHVCDEWRFGRDGKIGFECFVEDMGKKPSMSHTLDRIENDKGYCLSNCRWATKREQVLNRKNSLMVDGEYLADLAKKHGIHYVTLQQRYYAGLRGEALFRAVDRKQKPRFIRKHHVSKEPAE